MVREYTSVEQSIKLVKLGLDPNTANAYYFLDPTPAGNIYHLAVQRDDMGVRNLPKYNDGDLPCWSLTALLILMPYRTETLKKKPFDRIMKRDVWDGEFCFICYPKGLEKNKHLSSYHSNTIDAAFEIICWLLENGYIKKE